MSNVDENKDEWLEVINDTAKLLANRQARVLETAVSSNAISDNLAGNVEFWSWMNRNYSSAGGGMFSSNQAMNDYIKSGSGKAMWMEKQLQGKGYEFDWVQKQRHNPLNIFKKYDLGDVSNQPAIDAVEKNLLTGKESSYQMKAYTSKSNPHLQNTGKDVTVITNAEKVDVVSDNGYAVESFKDNNEIKSDILQRQKSIENGSATPSYTISNVAGTMAKAGLAGCVIGMGTEAVLSYKKMKNGEISEDEYITEVLKSGGETGVTSGVTAGIMIPVNAAITAAGVTSVVGIPIAIAISAGVDKIVAPCFGRGEYKNILGEATYCQSLESMYVPFMKTLEYAADEYKSFADKVTEQDGIYNKIREKDRAVNKALKNLYDSI